MCGIVGVLGVGADVNKERLRNMVASLRHRGPNYAGVWCDEAAGVGLGHARLSIVDLSSAGHQPMPSASERYVVVFNGEIYNHLDMRRELDRACRAPVWRGSSDTETLLAGFDAWGIVATTKKCIGMFAFAVWDKEASALTLARDRLGEKPLYYGWNKGTFFFGSELKAFKAHPAFIGEINRNAVAAFMRYGYIPAPQSIYCSISKLPPATLLTVRSSEGTDMVPAPFWSLLDVARRGMHTPFFGSDAEAVTALESRLSEAVTAQQMSDVPVGAFLSGGIDSSTIVALMQAQSSRPVHTFTIGFDSDRYDEAGYARAVAKVLGTDHTELYVTPEEARAVIPILPTLYDEPFADSSQIPTFLVSQLARRRVAVSLSGDGGDEIFGGYNRYMWTRNVLMVPAPFRRLLARGLTALSPSGWDRLHAALQPVLPSSVRMRMAGHKAHKLAGVLQMNSDSALYQGFVSTWPHPNELVIGGQDGTDMSAACEALADFPSIEQRMMALDAVGYLPDDILCKVDRAAMGASLETRVPFLDHRVVEFAWHLPLHMKIRHRQSKWILRQLLYKYVPKALVERPKMGFSVPIDVWLRGPLREWAESLLDESRLRQEGYLAPALIRQRWAEHLTGERDWQYQLWNVLMFQAWHAEWV